MKNSAAMEQMNRQITGTMKAPIVEYNKCYNNEYYMED